MCVYTCLTVHVEVEYSFKSWFCPSIMRVLEIELRLFGLAQSPSSLSQPAQACLEGIDSLLFALQGLLIPVLIFM